MKREGVDAEVYRQVYSTAVRIRRCDQRFAELLMSGEIAIIYYSPRGQELISAAFGALLTPRDYMVTTYRGIHDHIAKGVPLGPLWAEFLGKETGTCKGKGGGMHITDPSVGLMVTTGLVGAGLPIANGLALAAQLEGANRVTVCNFGDGATNIGAFHEALNLAALWNLPVVFVCQNNLYGEKTPFERHASVGSVAERGAAYNMRSERVDGNALDEIWGAAKRAVEAARSGDGPTLIEAMTFRFCGHNFGDDSGYMPVGLLDAAIARDPLTKLREQLVLEAILSETELQELESEIDREVDEAVNFALKSEYPGPETLLHDVYATEVSR
jgi:TPP-dependent pyruvate/acetoin dehydrogenase alpha subunit